MNKSKFKGIKIPAFLAAVLLAAAALGLSAFTWPWDNGTEIMTADGQPVYKGKDAKYVFLFIGDGMALPQINAAEAYLSATCKDGIKPEKLILSQFPSQGLTTTYSADAFITDSAAASTAIACGRKTNSGVIAMDPEKKNNFKTIAEMARDNGMKVGIVSSVSIDHATPACFYSHETTRNNYYEIATQIADSGFDYFAGGGMKGNSAKKRKDRPNVINILNGKGYSVVDNKADFMAISPADNLKVVAYDRYLDGDYALSFELDRPADSISLAEFTAKGIDILDNDKGFFMMVEGGKIDWACHANDAGSSIRDTLAFDEAIGVALDFYNKHPEETMIVVTGDHECGGMTLGFAGTKYGSFFDKVRYQTKSYIAFDEELAAYKETHKAKDARLADLHDAIEGAFGLVKLSAEDRRRLEKMTGNEAARATLAMAFSDYEYARVEEAFARSIKGEQEKSSNTDTYLLYGGYEPLSVTLTHILNNKAGIAWTSYSHTGVPVPTFAKGLGHAMFNGYYDNTAIFNRMTQIMGL